MARSVTYIMELEFALIFNFICTVFIGNFSFLRIVSKVIRQLLTLKWNKTLYLKMKVNSQWPKDESNPSVYQQMRR